MQRVPLGPTRRGTSAVRFGALLGALFLAGCSHAAHGDAVPPAQAFAWNQCAPEAEGVDSSRLAAVLTDIAAGQYGLHSLLVVRHGCIVLDADFFPYDGTRPHDIASCTKSLTALAVGVGLAQGAITSLDDTLAQYLTDRTFGDPSKAAISVSDLLTMRSGIACDSDSTLLLAMTSAPDWIGYALGLPQASTPGTTWQYCSPAAHLLSGVLTAATGLPEDELLQRTVLAPLGIERPIWPRDPQGVSTGWGNARFQPRDLARLGLLLLHEGTWEGRQLVDASWLSSATQNQVGSTGPAGGYGYLWWPTPGGFYANGRGGQNLLVMPSADLVVVTTGAADPTQLQAQRALHNELIASLLADTPLPANPPALAQLEALVGAAREPPAPSSVSALPDASSWASGQQFQLDDNLLGWTALTLSFGDSEAELAVVVGETQASATVGLDGVPRVTRGLERFGLDPRYEDLDIALDGRWTDDTTFELTFDTIDRIDAGTMRFSLADGTLQVTVHEKTYFDADLTLSGTQAK